MYYDPSPHQLEDSDIMIEQEVSYLWADAGTGKTVTAMEAIRKGGFEKVVVLCPKMAVTMWKEELELHLMHDSKLGNEKYSAYTRRGAQLPKGVNIHWRDALIVPFGVARNLYKSKEMDDHRFFHSFQMGGTMRRNKLERKPHWDERYKTAFIIDEAHNLKSVQAQQTRAVLGQNIDQSDPRRVVHGANAIMQLTGTPVTRYFDDLWTQLRAGRAELLKYYNVYEYKQFVDKFCQTKMIKRGQKFERVVCGNTNHALLTKLLEDAGVIRRALNDVVANMPPVTHRIVDTDYKSVPAGGIGKMSEAELMKALGDSDSEASTIRRKLGLAKVKSIVEYIDEYGQAPYLIGYWHTEVGQELFERLGGEGYAIVSGATSTKRRDLIREQFNAGELTGIIGQMSAMNTSWNLQEISRHVIIAEEMPSPALLHQFYSRVYRRGQKNHVQIDHMLSTHQLDIALRNIRLSKQADNERIGV